jgi:hypothetical protein
METKMDVGAAGGELKVGQRGGRGTGDDGL